MSTSLKGLDSNFKYLVAEQTGGENLKRSFACGVCTCGCLISEIGEPFDPRKIIRMVLFGMKERVLSSASILFCLMCHNRSFHCPQDVRFSDVIGALRYLAVREGFVRPSLLRRMILNALLPSHTRLEFFSRPLKVYQKLGLSSFLRTYLVLYRFPEKLGSLEYLLSQVPAMPLSRRLQTLTPAKSKTKQKVGFFLNGTDDLIFHNAGLATVSVMAENSCEALTPKSVECCGIPSLAYGEVERAQKLAKHNINVFCGTGRGGHYRSCYLGLIS